MSFLHMTIIALSELLLPLMFILYILIFSIDRFFMRRHFSSSTVITFILIETLILQISYSNLIVVFLSFFAIIIYIISHYIITRIIKKYNFENGLYFVSCFVVYFIISIFCIIQNENIYNYFNNMLVYIVMGFSNICLFVGVVFVTIFLGYILEMFNIVDEDDFMLYFMGELIDNDVDNVN